MAAERGFETGTCDFGMSSLTIYDSKGRQQTEKVRISWHGRSMVLSKKFLERAKSFKKESINDTGGCTSERVVWRLTRGRWRAGFVPNHSGVVNSPEKYGGPPTYM